MQKAVDTATDWIDGKTLLTGLFVGAIVIGNVLASKIAAFDVPGIGLAAAPAGFVALGAAFLFSDTLSEVYGPKEAHKAVNSAVVAVIVALGLIHISVQMPAAPFYELSAEYEQIISSSTSISLASVLTMLVSQNLDVSVFHKLKKTGLPKWVRNIGSTVTSQFVDTALFIMLGFYVFPQFVAGTLTPLSAIGSLIVSQYILKIFVAVIDTPLFYLLTAGSETE